MVDERAVRAVAKGDEDSAVGKAAGKVAAAVGVHPLVGEGDTMSGVVVAVAVAEAAMLHCRAEVVAVGAALPQQTAPPEVEPNLRRGHRRLCSKMEKKARMPILWVRSIASA